MSQTAGKQILKRELTRFFAMILASLLMALNIKTFVRTGGLYPGGATGLTILILRAAKLLLDVDIPYTIINVILNAIPVYIGFRFIGKKFTLYSCLMIVVTGLFTDFIPGYVITYDTLLISIFGGIVNGLAISLCLINDATSGGTDFIAIYLSEKKNMESWNLILGMNIVILCTAGLMFGWDKALYSIIFQYVSTQILHFAYRKYQHETLLIVTNKPDEVCAEIYKISHHGATILDGEGSYEHTSRPTVYSIVSKAEYHKVINRIREVDPDSFINSLQTEHMYGRFYHKRED
ncbi:YitT family protein [Treponema zioleckii]|uniref:YitT family protein n=1 Tax=Treponema zioleckii TaxID=331680 RepID=UPI00168A7E8B|nr:YitT family protein [Treponema zioleckii]